MMDNMTTEQTSSVHNASGCLVLQPTEFIPWDNPDTIISFETDQVIRKVKDLVVVPITFLIGVPANIINMAVFYKQGLKERINVCLFALSFSDMMYLVINTVRYGEQLYLEFTTKERYGPVLRWIANNNLLGFQCFFAVSQVLSAIIASERCFCILQPLKSQNILRTSTMAVIIVVASIVIMGGRFIVSTRYYLICAYDPFRDSIIYTQKGQPFYYRHKKLVDFLDIFMYGLGIPWVVIVVVMITTVITVIKLRQAAELRADMSSSSGRMSARDIALTRMLVGNSIFFFFCVFPEGFYRFGQLLLPEMNSGRRNNNLYSTGLWLVTILSHINSTFNFIIYYTMGSRYRRIVHTLLGRKIAKDNPSKTSASRQTIVS